MNYLLHRLKVRPLGPRSLFRNNSERPGQIILSAVQEKPSLEPRKGQHWRIGNVKCPQDNTVLFALGKVTKKTQELYNEQEQNFVAHDLALAPHTYVAVDLHLQVCAIAPKNAVSQKHTTIARNLARLLNESKRAKEGKLEFTITEIPEPSDFVELIRKASRISSFEMTFSPPNPFDPDEQIQRPMEDLLREVGASKGKASVSGKKLNADVLETLSRAAASSGEKAAANIQSPEDAHPVRRRLSGSPVRVSVTGVSEIWDKMRAAYNRVRRDM